jgi:hypothetical protein
MALRISGFVLMLPNLAFLMGGEIYQAADLTQQLSL